MFRAKFSLFASILKKDYFDSRDKSFEVCYKIAADYAKTYSGAVPSKSWAARYLLAMADGSGAERFKAAPMADGYDGTAKPLEHHMRDLEEMVRQIAVVDRVPKPFFTPEETEKFRLDQRHRNVERAKEILEICRGVQLHGLVGEGDLARNSIAERLADLIFGKF